MRVELFVLNDDEPGYVPAWIDETTIIGYYITLDNYHDDSVNLIMTSNDLTVKQNDTIMNYLHNRFGYDELKI